jgi:hypothetical protein
MKKHNTLFAAVGAVLTASALSVVAPAVTAATTLSETSAPAVPGARKAGAPAKPLHLDAYEPAQDPVARAIAPHPQARAGGAAKQLVLGAALASGGAVGLAMLSVLARRLLRR